MIVYADTSALVKLYVDEPGQEVVRRTMKRARVRATGIITYVELHSALARAKRVGVLDDGAASSVLERVEDGWVELDHVPVDSKVVNRAGELATDLGLRAYDAVHLASADRLRAVAGELRFVFACFDDALNRAARLLGFETLTARMR